MGITIKEIAALAGVSPTTVANVLHGRTGKVSEKTYEAVKRALEENHYTPNMGARMIGNCGSRLIAVVMNFERRERVNTVQNPFFGEIIGALETEIRREGYYMLLYTSGSAEETVRLASTWNVEGIILIGLPPWKAPKIREFLKIPMVYIDTYFPDKDDGYDNVGLQDFEGGYEMTRFLIRQGHKRIAFLADGEKLVGVDYWRYQGYCRALSENGYPGGDYYCLPYEKSVRNEMLRQFCREHLQKYTALFFASDFYAADAVKTFHRQGIRVPEDISVAGFDDNIFAKQCQPGLTTIRQYVSEKGRVAVEKLMKLIRGEKDTPRNIKLPVELILRESVQRIE
ncbi:MAG: LacI family DNA-binding transcriptional regulator [Eubacteriales bacterium]|nr:LacI family DNA-binding transcriptional regulator [Eubacteriales bacterium]